MGLIVFDLDNTLLRSDKTISEYSLEVIKRIKEKGIKIAFATARSERAAQRFIKAAQPYAVISNGGSLVRCVGETIHRCTLSKETSNGILNECLKSKAAGLVTLETGSGYYVNWKYPFSLDYAHAINSDFSRPLTEDTYKMSIQFVCFEAAKEIADKYPECGLTASSGEDWYFFANRNSNKMNGIKALASVLGIDLKDVVSFGDDFNDLEMLRGCGVGVAMGNAIDEAKAAADYICGKNDEDGAAEWLDDNILKILNKGASNMEFLELAKKRYSCRAYSEKKVEREKLEKILEAGRIAPTAKNLQPQRILVLQEKEGLDKIGKAANIYKAPLALVVCIDTDTVWTRPFDGYKTIGVDASIVTDHMMMQATELGLNSVWICYFKPDVIKAEFNLPENLIPVNILAVGYGIAAPKSPERFVTERKPMTETAFYEGL